MKDVIVVCEGQTEKVFVNEVLAPSLWDGNVFLDDGSETHPSARLRNLLRPRYGKVRHGRAVSARIGVSRMRAVCGHFDRWVARMEALPPLRSGSPA